jgi:hypothetical protein
MSKPAPRSSVLIATRRGDDFGAESKVFRIAFLAGQGLLMEILKANGEF